MKEEGGQGKCMFLQLLYFISHAECINSEWVEKNVYITRESMRERGKENDDDENACHEV